MSTPLPQCDRLFLTDSGLETDLIYNHGIELPDFAAFTLAGTPEGRTQLEAYYRRHLDIARAAGTGFILESPTWRASADWAKRLGIDDSTLAGLIGQSLTILKDLRAEYRTAALPIVISGCIGPRGDGYVAPEVSAAASAQAYHAAQIACFAAAGVDMVAAITMTNVEEAIGIVRAAGVHALPVAISFTVETDGRLPTGQMLGDAILATDAATDATAAYFMVNCAHPSHIEHAIADGAPWLQRLRGVRANASECSHAELDAMTTLDAGDPEQLAADYAALCQKLPNLTVLGGCCGTDARHIAAIALACAGPHESA